MSATTLILHQSSENSASFRFHVTQLFITCYLSVDHIGLFLVEIHACHLVFKIIILFRIIGFLLIEAAI